MSAKYQFSTIDLQIVEAARDLTARLARSGALRPEQLVSVAKVQQALSRLPGAVDSVRVTIGLSERIEQDGCGSLSYWQLSMREGRLELLCGGSEHSEGVGSDSFTTMQWSAHPGARPEFGGSWDRAWMQEDEYSDRPVYGFDFSDTSISIEDDDNRLLFEESDDHTNDSAAPNDR